MWKIDNSPKKQKRVDSILPTLNCDLFYEYLMRIDRTSKGVYTGKEAISIRLMTNLLTLFLVRIDYSKSATLMTLVG